MNQRTIFILGALIVAIIVTLLIFKQKKTKPVSTRPVVSVLFATRDISPGKALLAGDFVWQTLSKNEVLSPDLILKGSRRDQDIIGSKILAPLIADQPIKTIMIVGKGVLSPLASILKPGMRAFTIDVSNASAFAGLIKPGDIVDIILTYKKKMGSTRELVIVSETIIHNVHVIAIDDHVLYAPKDETKSSKMRSSPSSSKHVTLELTPKQAELVAQAKATGTLSLSLMVPDSQEAITADTQQEAGIFLFHGEKAEEIGGS